MYVLLSLIVLLRATSALGLNVTLAETKNMSRKPLDVVRNALQVYADRGIFRGLDELKTRNGKHTFRFVWFGDQPLDFIVDTSAGLLTFKRLLPNVPSNSTLYSELRRFIKSRSDRSLPKHRQVDSRRAEVMSMNRGGVVSIALKVKKNQYAYGLNRLINVVHEVFVQLTDTHPDYMCENFDAPQE